MVKIPRDIIDKKICKDGLDSFKSVSMSDLLAESGSRPGRDDLLDIVTHLCEADILWYLPVISSALKDLAEDSNEFATLVSRIANKTCRDLAQGSFVDFLVELGTGRPDLAVRLARRLVKLGNAHHAAYLAGGAMRGAPAECGSIATSLMRSDNAGEAAAGVMCLRIAWKKDGITDIKAGIKALAPAMSRPDGAAAAAIMDALIDLYPVDAEAAGRMIEDMARGRARCRSRLAARTAQRSCPFDDAAALHYLALCAGGSPDSHTTRNIYMALARLSEENPDAAVKAVADIFDIRHASEGMGYALQEIGRTRPASLTTAILGKVGAAYTPLADMRLHSIVADIAEHADPNVITNALFVALDLGGAAARPALRMINAMVTLNCDAIHNDDLASRTLSRLFRYAQARGIDTKRLQKEQRSAYLKSAAVIRRILHPPPAVDVKSVLKNLEMFPSLEKAFGSSWFKRAVNSASAPHPLVIYLSTLSLEKTESLLDSPQGETFNERHNREFRLYYESRPLEILSFLNGALSLLDGAGMGINKYVRNMKNADQFMDTFSEIVLVVPFVAGKHPVVLEPPVGGKQLDAAIELGPQRVLVEVFSPRMWEPVDLLEGSRGIPMDRAGGKIFGKVTEQLSAVGACTDPIIVAIDTTHSEITLDTVEGYVLGPLTYTIPFDTDAGRAVGSGSAGRDIGECMHNLDDQTDLISAVVCFAPTMSSDMSAAAKGVIIENPHARVPLSPATRDELARALQCAPPDDGGRGGGPP